MFVRQHSQEELLAYVNDVFKLLLPTKTLQGFVQGFIQERNANPQVNDRNFFQWVTALLEYFHDPASAAYTYLTENEQNAHIELWLKHRQLAAVGDGVKASSSSSSSSSSSAEAFDDPLPSGQIYIPAAFSFFHPSDSLTASSSALTAPSALPILDDRGDDPMLTFRQALMVGLLIQTLVSIDVNESRFLICGTAV